jgi:hypothetical protein
MNETRFYHSIQDPFAKLSDFVATTWQKQEIKIAGTLSGEGSDAPNGRIRVSGI